VWTKPEKIEIADVIRIDCPEWFERADFRRWLNNPDKPNLATWHTTGKDPDEYSDIFMTYDHGEGSDAYGPPDPDEPAPLGDFPDDIWEDICEVCRNNGIDYCVIWLSNVGG